jgi:hypothetical protein
LDWRAKDLAASSINVQLAAIRKLVWEAAGNGIISQVDACGAGSGGGIWAGSRNCRML